MCTLIIGHKLRTMTRRLKPKHSNKFSYIDHLSELPDELRDKIVYMAVNSGSLMESIETILKIKEISFTNITNLRLVNRSISRSHKTTKYLYSITWQCWSLRRAIMLLDSTDGASEAVKFERAMVSWIKDSETLNNIRKIDHTNSIMKHFLSRTKSELQLSNCSVWTRCGIILGKSPKSV